VREQQLYVDGSAVIVWQPDGRDGVQAPHFRRERALLYIHPLAGQQVGWSGGDEGTGSGRCFLPWALWPRLAASVRPCPIVRRAAAMVVARERCSSADPACSVRALACCCCPFEVQKLHVAGVLL
jgi:hypothetical protein